MRHIKLFENFDEISEDKIDDFIDTLKDRILWEYNIEEIDLYEELDIKTVGKYWSWINFKSSKIGKAIVIGNIDTKEYVSIINDLISMQVLLFGRSGILIEFEYIYGFKNDIVIKLDI